MSNLFKAAIDKFGYEAQLGVLQEECAELIVAASHVLRERDGAMREFIEELVDTHIMVLQMIEYLDAKGCAKEFSEMWNNKLGRLEQRLKDEYNML